MGIGEAAIANLLKNSAVPFDELNRR